ncbi:DUF3667 domain-containing protein [Microbulbifer sp. SA54]|uniref:DUF3667 domain-containing protein n=1 Tax=Microbulbifer sp. SA54 TaxID=3401577 RepID=UPI003AAF289B
MSETDILTEQETTSGQLPEQAPKPTANDPAGTPEARCGNCNEPLLGSHCYACGQPAKGLVRHFPELIGDFFESVFGLDSRISRTLGPLLCKPGFLTNEYLAGRRMRYVSPVRLFVFLCLTAFFLAQFSSDWRDVTTVNVTDAEGRIQLSGVEQNIAEATSIEEVLRLRDQALADIEDAARESTDVPGMRGVMAGFEQVVRGQAQRRIRELDPTAVIDSDSQPQQRNSNPLQIAGAPQAINTWLEKKSERLANNIGRIQQDPNLLKDALFGAIPSALFIMLPFFALLLSVLYLLKRRLYMEHLIVALHSHAFLSLALLLAVVLFDLRAWLATPGTFVDTLFTLTLSALAVWVPVYLLLMQKRVYRQGWLATSVKFTILGIGYLTLLGTATTFTALTSIVNL